MTNNVATKFLSFLKLVYKYVVLPEFLELELQLLLMFSLVGCFCSFIELLQLLLLLGGGCSEVLVLMAFKDDILGPLLSIDGVEVRLVSSVLEVWYSGDSS